MIRSKTLGASVYNVLSGTTGSSSTAVRCPYIQSERYIRATRPKTTTCPPKPPRTTPVASARSSPLGASSRRARGNRRPPAGWGPGLISRPGKVLAVSMISSPLPDRSSRRPRATMPCP
ncbi:unnamed protein product [Ectocarpus sp. 12 AP-2014]